MAIQKHFDQQTWQRIKAFSDTKPTPFLVVDLPTVERKYRELQEAFPEARIFYAIKANPAVEVLQLLADLGSCFDVASIYELDRVLAIGVSPDRLSFGNTIKKRSDIKYFYEKGVRTFATDSDADLANIAFNAPGSNVYIRILTEGDQTADWPLSRKFGCQTDMALDLVNMAKRLSLHPIGVSFHVGSQQRDIGAWDAAIAKVNQLFYRLLEEDNIRLKVINMGGGFPAQYLAKAHSLSTYAQEIHRFLKEDFGDDIPELILEPGRSLVGDAGVLVSEVVLISRKSVNALNRWVYTDVGKFQGMIETLDEAIKYPLYTEKSLYDDNIGESEEVIIAGPTCDSMDILYEDYKYTLPMNMAIGDRLYWCSTGAYTTSYSSVEFNGFPPLKAYFL
ncbi:MAG: type III PLP-dependent enzyme [Spirochaetales bacterium]|nr:type III PLP-dependent enzyme [Spirochaetales bacterium]